MKWELRLIALLLAAIAILLVLLLQRAEEINEDLVSQGCGVGLQNPCQVEVTNR